jgi:hypothetical protein
LFGERYRWIPRRYDIPVEERFDVLRRALLELYLKSSSRHDCEAYADSKPNASGTKNKMSGALVHVQTPTLDNGTQKSEINPIARHRRHFAVFGIRNRCFITLHTQYVAVNADAARMTIATALPSLAASTTLNSPWPTPAITTGISLRKWSGIMTLSTS